ncbi:cyclic nucleotide-binding domain-containing protein [Roseospirillum parvum]|uniref:Cyclic nucleotide-binding domain-containing protein n=1 Tax=Roseospirillum parvum TaxID=83401 RepID=A0A1G7XJJ4_9PROT|nr:cyclic nucleotide-binding domain-containing protein [Roseospirillum parvum]SDG84372.1 Cyclic nucleotide-binding domain-containing protein [Roseospirillum parvum]
MSDATVEEATVETELEARVVPAGTILFHEGDPGDAAFIVEAGVVELTRNLKGSTVVIASVPIGQVIGEMALIDNMPRSATARCLTETCIRIIPKDDFQTRLAAADPVLRKVLMRFSRLVRAITDEKVRTVLGIR